MHYQKPKQEVIKRYVWVCFYSLMLEKKNTSLTLNATNAMDQEVQEESGEVLHPCVSVSPFIAVLHRLLLHVQTPRSGSR